jgi:hypothetical protein
MILFVVALLALSLLALVFFLGFAIVIRDIVEKVRQRISKVHCPNSAHARDL